MIKFLTRVPSFNRQAHGSDLKLFITEIPIQPPQAPEKPKSFPLWAIALLPAVATLLAYLPLGQNGFVSWDDMDTIVRNGHIRDFGPASLKWIFTSAGAGYWIPLTWLSLDLDYHLGGLNPQIYHWDNLFLHLVNVTLVFWLAHRILQRAWGPAAECSEPAALLTAILFGIHPLHVESVAWATERKDVLYGAFYLAGLLAYLGYASDPQKPKRKLAYCFLFYLLSLMSKPMAVSFPFALLVLDYWPLRRLAHGAKKIFFEKIPFFIPLLVTAALAVSSQEKTGATPDLQILPLDFRVMNAFHSLAFYAQKLVLPFGFSALYPIVLKSNPFSVRNLVSAGLVAAACAAAWRARKQRPYWTASWVYYLLTLAPALGIVQVGSHAAADRYAYLTTLSLILLFSACLAAGWGKNRSLFTLFTLGLSLFLGALTWRQVEVWRDSISLWENAVRVSPDPSEIAFSNLGLAYREAGRPGEALEAFDQGLALDPGMGALHYGKGLALSDEGDLEGAVGEYRRSIALDPTYSPPHANLCVAYQRLGKYDEAVAEALEAVRLDAHSAQAYNNLGVSYGYKGRIGEALKAFQQAVALEPDSPMYQGNLAAATSMLKKP